MWTRFMDTHSGGGQKLSHAKILIEAPEKEAEIIFQNRFNRNPNRVTCTCCGEDYSISEAETLEEVTAYDRGCCWDEIKKSYVEEGGGKWNHNTYITIQDYLNSGDALILRTTDIKPEERVGELREEGYIWKRLKQLGTN